MKKLLITITGLFILPLSLYAAGEQIVDIDIEGMSCEFCAHSVQKNINKLPGVEKASVNIDDKKAHIVMAPGKQANIELLKKKISDSGFVPVKVTISTRE
ncbi:Lead, cadmium, zinc and mercury transporting ATPase; Copper-translocating P-type ATPase [hydrothermal vent metagenome]|uniref:Lead, cadmium, zinc and mercury transporting ATPase Copper-translocating P-type ATPase n=1 Tax=hydrothermal vent metagenome TaxID=652676 RepID=A0A3B1ADT4_9ZZZZ